MARMPSTRSQPLNPRVAGLPVPPTIGRPPAMRRSALLPAAPPAAPVSPAEDADPHEVRAAAARAGGFHESSYELRLGLDVSESEWPDDTTVPGKLGER